MMRAVLKSLTCVAVVCGAAFAQETTPNRQRTVDGNSEVKTSPSEREIDRDRAPEERPAREIRTDNPRGDGNRALEFIPQNDRERALFEMIRQLRAEVSSLRRQLEMSRSTREVPRDQLRFNRDQTRNDAANSRPGPARVVREGGDMRRPPEGQRDSSSATRNPMMQKAQRIFAAYDKNKDGNVSFEEWLAMREGEMTSERRSREQQHFSEPAGDDQRITLEEFYRWMERRSRGAAVREGSSQVPKREGS